MHDAKVRMAFAERLKTAMDRQGVTRYSLAKATHIAPGAVYYWMQGVREPSAESLRRICYALEISADWLLGLKGVDE